ncbi:MAG: hypothetical protein WCJ81_03265 [bacterium]
MVVKKTTRSATSAATAKKAVNKPANAVKTSETPTPKVSKSTKLIVP